MFLVPHPKTPIPTVDVLAAQYARGTTLTNILLTATLIAIVYFMLRHVQLLVANLVAHFKFRKTDEYKKLISSNAEVQLMAIPLTLGMTVNVAFIAGALSVPGLWDIKEYLFPIALLANMAIGGLALHLFGRYLTRILTSGSFNVDDTNHFSQVLPSFAFTMVAVGFSAQAAMSDTKIISVLGAVFSFVFLAAALTWAFVKLPISFAAMLRSGMAKEAGPTLWLAIPIITLASIALFRIAHGIAHHLAHTQLPNPVWFVFFGLMVAMQIVIWAFGFTVMRKQGYFAHFVRGEGRSIPSYGLICPGVAFVVLAHFFIGRGLVANHIVDKFSAAHLLLLAGVFAVQLITVWTLARLNAKLYHKPALGFSKPAVAKI
ncbi:MAG: hypothetical protein CSA83_01390 [Actinomycetales bacterium]|nr:MAG: hypothetical protein CSA83_01390 [Actinomycetales bacterium]